MKVDLLKVYAVQFDFSTEVDFGDVSPVEIFGDYAERLLDKRPVSYGDVYSRRKVRHILINN